MQMEIQMEQIRPDTSKARTASEAVRIASSVSLRVCTHCSNAVGMVWEL